MSWIKTIRPESAQGRLKNLYDRLADPDGQVDHVLQIHSLRPHTLEGHMALYKNVLHHPANELPKWFLEAIGVYVSQLNGCAYCVDHHVAGMRRLLGKDDRADAVRDALLSDKPQLVFDDAELALMRYARQLTMDPSGISRDTIDELHGAGADDGQVLEVNQVVSYFCYVNRTVLGLGVSTEGESLGRSPNNPADSEDWGHR